MRQLLGEHIPAALRESPADFRLGVCVVLDVDGEGEWTLDLRAPAPSAQEGASPRADLRIALRPAHLARIMEEPDRAMDLYHRGEIQVTGNLGRAPDVITFFQVLRAAPKAAGTGVLARLLGSYGVDRFKAENWPGRHVVVHEDVERLAGIHDLKELTDIRHLLDAWTGVVNVFPTRAGDERDAPAVRPEQAAALWERGFALVFNAAHRGLPRLAPLLRTLQDELGIPPTSEARCLVYATPREAGARPHFDQNVNFVVQLHGEKVWRLAPNDCITSPTVRHVMGTEPATELRLQATREFPATMPADALTVRLRRGSVLFLPAGYWHTTVGSEDAVSLNFTFSLPSWADLVSEAVRRRLVLHPRWRELAQGAGSPDPAAARAARSHLDRLLAGFTADLGRLDAASMLAGLGGAARPAPSPLDLKRDWVETLLGEQES